MNTGPQQSRARCVQPTRQASEQDDTRLVPKAFSVGTGFTASSSLPARAQRVPQEPAVPPSTADSAHAQASPQTNVVGAYGCFDLQSACTASSHCALFRRALPFPCTVLLLFGCLGMLFPERGLSSCARGAPQTTHVPPPALVERLDLIRPSCSLRLVIHAHDPRGGGAIAVVHTKPSRGLRCLLHLQGCRTRHSAEASPSFSAEHVGASNRENTRHGEARILQHYDRRGGSGAHRL